MKKPTMKKYSEEFLEGVLFTEDTIQESVFEVGLDSTKAKILKGYRELLEDVMKHGDDFKIKDKLFGGIYALHLFLKRHGITHDEWRFKN
jgi:hypothetical protein